MEKKMKKKSDEMMDETMDHNHDMMNGECCGSMEECCQNGTCEGGMCGSGHRPHKGMKMLMLILLLATTVFSFFAFWRTMPSEMKRAIEEVDAYKFGGMDNYTLWKQVVSSPAAINMIKGQLQQQMQQIQAQGNQPAQPQANANTGSNDQAQPQAQQFPGGTLTKEQVAMFKAIPYIEGNKNAKILWIEYSDLECPFCKRLHDEGTPAKVLDTYKNDVAIIFQHFPLPFHAHAMPAAVAAECAATLGKGSETFYGFINWIFANGVPTTDLIKKAGDTLKLDSAKFTACMSSTTYDQKIKDQSNQGAAIFKITGTPGNVLLNTENGNWVLIAGAYPYDAFKTEIDKLLK